MKDDVRELASLGEDAMARRLRALYEAAPELVPVPEMHDYQLTYPPAIALEKKEHARTPGEGELLALALGELPATAYYFHFGYCAYRCSYCFHYELKTKRNEDEMAAYVAALAAETKRAKELFGHTKNLLYFLGGGTPTALPIHLVERFLDGLIGTLGRPPTAMSTVEAKPVTATKEKLRAFVAAGFSRINLGVQTFDRDLYARHHHGEDVKVAHDAIDRARAAGYSYVNIDVMTGLPGQTPAAWENTLAELRRLCKSGMVDSVFVYPYHDDPRSASYGKAGTVPSFAEIARTDATARALFQDLGFSELGARFYRSRRHVAREIVELARTRKTPAYGEVLYHGIGNSSFSVGDRLTYLNHRDVGAYTAAVEAGNLGISHAVELRDEQRAARDVTFDLLYSPITRVSSRVDKYGVRAMAHQRDFLRRWVDVGLGEESRLFGTFSLTPLGKLVHQQMIPLHYLPADRERLTRTMRVRKELGRRYRGY